MPIQVDQIEPHIFRNVLSGSVSLRELQQVVKKMRELADQTQETYYAVISDATRLGTIPFDVQNLRKVAEIDPRMIAILVIKSPFVVRVAADIVSRVTRLTMEHVNTESEGLERARQLVAAWEQRHSVRPGQPRP